MTRIGIDTGGTFTDSVLIRDGTVHTFKTPTTDDLISGITTACERPCEVAGVTPAEADAVTHGSTVALNTIIEENGPRTALVTTEGFADVLEIGEGYRDASLLYNPFGSVHEPLVPRKRRFEVPERVDEDGVVRQPVEDEHVDRVIEDLRDQGVETVAVCTLHSYENPVNERRIAGRIEATMDDVYVSTSADVSPKIREYSRTATTVVSAYVKPVVGDYLSRLEAELAERGMTGSVNVMNSSGGMVRSQLAAQRPVGQIISGPVAGITAAKFVGEQIGRDDLITFDMGGTSCDTGVIADGEVLEESHREIRGMPVNGPFVDVNTIGAGGGSIARLTEADALRVGPESAGADPGPVCYGRGGTRPTVTDADAVLGLLNPRNFADGSFDLDVSAARESICTHVAEPLDLSVPGAAVAIRDVIDSKMASAVRVVSVKRGNDPRDFSLVGYGGAGPMHACAVAAELGIDEVIFPRNPGIMSAFGLTLSDIKHDYVRSVVEAVPDLVVEDVDAQIVDLLERGAGELDTEEVPANDQRFSVIFEMMYEGQAHQLDVPVLTDLPRSAVGDAVLTPALLETAVSRFTERHRDRFDFVDESGTVTLTAVRVTATGLVDRPRIEVSDGAEAVDDALVEHRDVVHTAEETHSVPCYEWAALPVNRRIDGPAILELSDSTMWIPPTFRCELDDHRNLIARRTDR